MMRTGTRAIVTAVLGLGCAGQRAPTRPSPPVVSASPSEAEPPPRGERAVGPSVCARVMDRYIDLEIATNARLRSLPPDVLEKARQAARTEHADAPCTATPEQVECAMSATSTSAWRLCLGGRA